MFHSEWFQLILLDMSREKCFISGQSSLESSFWLQDVIVNIWNLLAAIGSGAQTIPEKLG